jgi:TrkA-C domain
MNGLYLLIPTLAAIFLSMLFVRAGAVALMLTGMHYEQAKFQALSAFTATGFTTREAEKVVNHPVRRKIISWLMVGGYAGIVAVTVSGISSFVDTTAQSLTRNVVVFVIGLALIYVLARHTGLNQRWERMVERWLYRSSLFEFEPVEELLHLADGFGLVKLEVAADSPLAGQSIIQIGSKRKETLVLGLERQHTWIPARKMREPLQAGDQLIVYGHLERLKEEFGTEA